MMFEQVKQHLKQLEQQLEVNRDIRQADKEVLDALAQDLRAHANGQPPENLRGRVQDAYERFSVSNPDLAVVLGSLMQILQNMGV